MKYPGIFLISMALAFSAVSCGGDAGNTGEGGPGVSPQDQVADAPVAAGLNTDLVTEIASDTTSSSTTGTDSQSSTGQTGQDATATTGTSPTTSTSTTSSTSQETVSGTQGDTGTQTSGTDSSGQQTTGQTIQVAQPSVPSGVTDTAKIIPVTPDEVDEYGSTTADDLADEADDDLIVIEDSSSQASTAGKALALDTSSGRWYVMEDEAVSKGQGKGQAKGQAGESLGIFTNWANEDLYLNISNNRRPGWYQLEVTAKNRGKLPDFYDNFSLLVKNETTGTEIGGIVVEASDTQYNKGRTLVYLGEGDTKLNLLWTNDAYKSGEYDANINIREVTLQYKGARRFNNSLRRNALQYSYLDGRFFWEANSAYTYWANQTMGFVFPNLKAGKYQVRVVAKNRGVLPPNYSNFNVEIDTNNGISGTMRIPADQNKYRTGTTELDLTGGETTLFLTWTNDSYRENEYDANFQFKRIILKRVGESGRSALAAYLIVKAQSNKTLMIMLGGLVIVLSGFFIWNRKRVSMRA